MLHLRGAIQHYAWGDRYALPELLEVTADGRPWAEIWFGTHPRGQAHVDDSLHHPAPTYLVDEVGELPFIVKLLAAAQPLSLQTHPSTPQAAAGFAREERAGVPLDAASRIYPDDRAKPEMIVALSVFEALCGFVDAESAIRACEQAGANELANRVRRDGAAAAAEAVVRGEAFGEVVTPSSAMRQLSEHYDDPRAIVALLMHHVRLQPGEALFLDAGMVHTYLHGVALEVQGSSDNVVRAAFTEKHIDVVEFLNIASLTSVTDPRVLPSVVRGDSSWQSYAYRCAAPFTVMRHDINGGFTLQTSAQHTVLVCTSGRAGSLQRGGVVYLSAGETVSLEGTATVFSVSQ
ncbi:MAG: mannose-6-phosphate isomerase, class I [Actinobacteria bacterium]|nr:mannose-6-phosphate isomerase, class I [Actinomycetota bacterium]